MPVVPMIVPTLVTGGVVAGGAAAVEKMTPKMPEMPKVPTAEENAAEVTKMNEAAKGVAVAKTKARRIAAARSQTIYTSPLGADIEAGVAKKTLLGQ